MKRLKEAIKEIWHVIRQTEMLILPGNLAFYLIMSIIPIVSLLGIVASLFSLSTDSIINFTSEILSPGVADILVPFIDGSSLNFNNIIVTLIGFYVASNGPDSMIIASNFLYKLENSSYLYRRTKALFMTFWLLLLFIFVLVVLAFGNVILNWLSGFEIIGVFIQNSWGLLMVLKFILAFCFIFVLIKILYTIAPDTKVKSKYVNRGTFIATLGIILATYIYSFYATNIADYTRLYGSLSNIIILMFLIYIISYILVLGMAINHNHYVMEKNNKIKKQ